MASKRRQQIEEVALRLFAERGFRDVSTKDIAEAAGIGESALYRHMESKDELAFRVFGVAYRGFAEKLSAALPEGGSLAGDVTALVETLYRAFDEDPVLLRFLVLRQHDSIPYIDLDEVNPVSVAEGIIDRALGRGEIQGDRQLALAVLMGIVLQPLVNALYGRIPTPVLPLAPQVGAFVLRALGASTAVTA
ncbi:TetR/AcrR family transcriptional regulator [Cereibacter sphaeroides]|uniref:TetR/AcrR family transcriptional regulator n=1 Tax=Cereibacter sphaeroides TaxID=1063 RepID=UPI001F1E8856|nr:TetR/AcrR family transcriptional regulator [Cereibacter sphaeroides]MCE6958319.1 TetR/AcrR family transcriptional regulator [Cereibacter sphaeroides]MCE6971929.1 TetR/AcrR family transcriptional regulator [Cereibacter sphaeroides]